ncbi:MAG: hypothetical protein R2939_16115 [Kofleriaceae bacterium]
MSALALTALVRGFLDGDPAAARALAATPRAAAVAAVRRCVVRAVHEHNQFAVVAAATVAGLEADLATALAAIASGADVGATLATERAARAARLPSAPPPVTCASYAPTLQLDLLGLDPASLRGPVLDVGCGPGALLVVALRAAGHDAHGVDRHLDAPGPWTRELDWADPAVATGTWGTILSHQALTLHLLHHHAAGAVAEARAAARTFAALAHALAPGGTLACVPGAPMVERALPATFTRERRPLPDELEAALAPLSRAVGEDVAYASVVRRR